MAGENEPAKLLLPYLQRADELQKHEPLVAYYCRLYAMERGLKIPQSERTKTTNSLLVSLMNQLEKDKKSLKLGPEDNLYIEGFAMNVFGKADKQDCAGRADMNTAKTFYAASIFFEILNQFGVLLPDLEQKQKYAAWKAADIRKALKEGRQPKPGPPAGDEDFAIPSSQPSNGHDLGPSETAHTSPQPDSDPSLDYHETARNQHSQNIPPPLRFHDTVDNHQYKNVLPSLQFHDKVDKQPPNVARSSPPYPSASYPPQEYHPPPSASRPEISFSQLYNHQMYPQEHSPHSPHNYHSPDTSYSYPHFQSYPSFAESSTPSISSNYPSYYQGSDTCYPHQPGPPSTNYSSNYQYNKSSSRNETTSPSSLSSQTYQYDSHYQPPPEKIAEAHKAARFAVGALAFDDISVAVDYLRKSLELLTKPSGGQ